MGQKDIITKEIIKEIGRDIYRGEGSGDENTNKQS